MGIYDRIFVVLRDHKNLKAGDLLVPHGKKRWCVCASPTIPTKFLKIKIVDVSWSDVKTAEAKDIENRFDHILKTSKEIAEDQIIEMSYFESFDVDDDVDDSWMYPAVPYRRFVTPKIDPLEVFEKEGKIPEMCDNIKLLNLDLVSKMSPQRKQGWVNRILKHIEYLKSKGPEFIYETDDSNIKGTHLVIFEKYYESLTQ